MTVSELKRILDQVPDETKIILPVDYGEEGVWYDCGSILAGFCDPDDISQGPPGAYTNLAEVVGGGVEMPLSTGKRAYPVLALVYPSSDPQNVYME